MTVDNKHQHMTSRTQIMCTANMIIPGTGPFCKQFIVTLISKTCETQEQNDIVCLQ